MGWSWSLYVCYRVECLGLSGEKGQNRHNEWFIDWKMMGTSADSASPYMANSAEIPDEKG